MTVALVKYNAGNIQSVIYALNRLGVEPVLSDDLDVLAGADKVIFPGVGEARSAMAYLQQRGLNRVIAGLQQPVLGICLGLQLLCQHSEENDTPCLGIFDCQVRRFPVSRATDGSQLKVPHMGWNRLTNLRGPLFAGLDAAPFVYFVHSFYAEPHSDAIAQTDYGITFSAALQRNNFHAVQFHPEKSGAVGARILENFLVI